MRIAIGSDHAGFALKRYLLERLGKDGSYEFVDLGTRAAEPPVDYPDFARAVAEAVVRGDADRGIMVCGSGAGAAIAADKVVGARAFVGGDGYSAHQAVEHDDANVLCLGERVTGAALALDLARTFLKAEFTGEERHRRRVAKITAYEAARQFPVEALRREGQSVWLDTISRGMLESGALRRLAWDDGVVGMTSNPTIFEKAMGSGKEYEAPAQALTRAGKTTEEIYWTLAVEDIRAAADIMRPVYQLTNGLDGYISLEVSPALADDTTGTLAMAERLWRELDRPNVMIKIPATLEGVPAFEDAIAHGVNVNVTLLFAVEMYEEVARAYIRGIQRFLSGREAVRLAHVGALVAAPTSVASFFVSRVDSLVDRLLGEKIGVSTDAGERMRLEGLLGRAAIANARLAYGSFQRIFAAAEWESLAARGAQVQRPLWASTSTKNPRYRDVMYVEELVGPRTVNTMPPATLEAFQAHGRVSGCTVCGEEVEARARATMSALAAVGIDMDAATLQLQREGVSLFADSFNQLMKTLEGRRQALVGAR